MLVSLIAFVLVSTDNAYAAPTRVPVAEPADEVSASEAYRLAAEYAGRLEKLERRASKSGLSGKEIADLQHDVARLSQDIGQLGQAVNDLQGQQAKLEKKVAKLQKEVKSLKKDVARLEARQVMLTVGLGANGMLAPEIPEHVAGASLSGVADLGFTVQDRRSGWVLSTEFGLTPDHGYSLGGYGVYYGKLHGAKRLALGGGVTGAFTAYDTFGNPKYGAYRWQVGATGYLRGNVVKAKTGWPCDIVVRPYFTVGEAAIPSESAFEVVGGTVLTFQLRKTLE